MNVNPICGRNNCKYKVPHEHVAFPKAETIKVAVADVPTAAVPEESVDELTAKIAKAVKGLAASEDPEADRFEGKTPEEARHQVLIEHFTRVKDHLDSALTIFMKPSELAAAQVEAAVNRVPQWASILTTNFERLYGETELMHQAVESAGKNLGTIFCSTNEAKRMLETLLTRKQHGFWWHVSAVFLGSTFFFTFLVAMLVLAFAIASHIGS